MTQPLPWAHSSLSPSSWHPWGIHTVPEDMQQTRTDPKEELENSQTPSRARIHVPLDLVSLLCKCLHFKITDIDSFAINTETTNRAYISLPARSQSTTGKCSKSWDTYMWLGAPFSVVVSKWHKVPHNQDCFAQVPPEPWKILCQSQTTVAGQAFQSISKPTRWRQIRMFAATGTLRRTGHMTTYMQAVSLHI